MEQTPPPETPQPSSAQQPQAPQNGGIDFQTLAKFILLLGFVVACYGGFQVLQNQPLPPPVESESPSGNFLSSVSQGIEKADRDMANQRDNSIRDQERTKAFKVCGIGALIIFAAFAIDCSVKRPQTTKDKSKWSWGW